MNRKLNQPEPFNSSPEIFNSSPEQSISAEQFSNTNKRSRIEYTAPVKHCIGIEFESAYKNFSMYSISCKDSTKRSWRLDIESFKLSSV